MNIENTKKIRAAVKEAGEYLKDKLQPTPDHPVRNPWAHLWREIKTKMGKSYIDCDDSDVDAIMQTIEYYRTHPC
jgi:hypothetical protein